MAPSWIKSGVKCYARYDGAILDAEISQSFDGFYVALLLSYPVRSPRIFHRDEISRSKRVLLRRARKILARTISSREQALLNLDRLIAREVLFLDTVGAS